MPAGLHFPRLWCSIEIEKQIRRRRDGRGKACTGPTFRRTEQGVPSGGIHRQRRKPHLVPAVPSCCGGTAAAPGDLPPRLRRARGGQRAAGGGQPGRRGVDGEGGAGPSALLRAGSPGPHGQKLYRAGIREAFHGVSQEISGGESGGQKPGLSHRTEYGRHGHLGILRPLSRSLGRGSPHLRGWRPVGHPGGEGHPLLGLPCRG